MTKGEQVRLTAWRLRVLRQAADEGNDGWHCSDDSAASIAPRWSTKGNRFSYIY